METFVQWLIQKAVEQQPLAESHLLSFIPPVHPAFLSMAERTVLILGRGSWAVILSSAGPLLPWQPLALGHEMRVNAHISLNSFLQPVCKAGSAPLLTICGNVWDVFGIPGILQLHLLSCLYAVLHIPLAVISF